MTMFSGDNNKDYDIDDHMTSSQLLVVEEGQDDIGLMPNENRVLRRISAAQQSFMGESNNNNNNNNLSSFDADDVENGNLTRASDHASQTATIKTSTSSERLHHHGLQQRFMSKRNPISDREYSAEDHSVMSGHSGLHVSHHKANLAPHVVDLRNTLREQESHSSRNLSHYRLTAVKTKKKSSYFRNAVCCCARLFTVYESSNNHKNSIINNLVIRYLYWAFRNSFTAVFLSFAMGFFLWTFFFALVLWLLGLINPTCINDVIHFVDAFALSWNTFSTVGYGLVHSGISSVEPSIHNCSGVTFVATVEAFIGLLFFSMCGAVIFAKVSRIQKVAQVEFSDPIVIRYSTGNTEGTAPVTGCDDIEEDAAVAIPSSISRLPFPMLEFRLANKLSSKPGGVIINATIKVIASIDADQEPPAIKKLVKTTRTKSSKRTVGRISRSTSAESSESAEYTVIQTNRSQPYVEDPTGYLVPKRVFCDLELESSKNPYFSRVWMIRHRIDSHSPLLNNAARELLSANNGYWPAERNTAELVRSSIDFDQILVSFAGISDADANTIFANKVYDFSSVNVGYTFVNMLYRNANDDDMHVDQHLINDVKEQYGGGAEPLVISDKYSKKDIVVM